MTFSGCFPSKQSATFWAATRPMRNIDSTVTPEWGLTRMLSSPKADATGLAKVIDGDTIEAIRSLVDAGLNHDGRPRRP